MKLATLSNVLHKLRCVEQRVTKEFEKGTGFSLTRYEILIFLRDHGDSSQREIAEYLEIDPAAITRHIKILDEKKYITKVRNEENGREVIVSLTDFARDELTKCKQNQCRKEYNLPIPLTEKEIVELEKILDQIGKKCMCENK